MPTTLFRPVGPHELALIWDLGMREFPPRLPHQPIFYPAINADYARQIARDWNTRDANSGFVGFVTEFAVDNAYIAKFAPHVAGALHTRNTGFHRKKSVHSTNQSPARFACKRASEIYANRKSVYLNCLFWAHHDSSESDVSRQQRGDFISNLKKLWEFNHVDVPLPGELPENATRSFHVAARTPD